MNAIAIYVAVVFPPLFLGIAAVVVRAWREEPSQ